MTEHFNRLTPAEAERLALLMEECAEVQQVIGKILRHGFASRHPANPRGPTNRQLLEREIGDLMFAINLLHEKEDVDLAATECACQSKQKTVWQYLHHNRD